MILARMMRSRKGVSTLFVGIFVLLATLGIIVSVGSYDEGESIGKKQYNLMISNERANSVELFIDEAFHISISQSVEEFFKNDGIYREETEIGARTEHKCGEYVYPIYSSPYISQECFPDFKANYKEFLVTNFEENIESHPGQSINFPKSIYYSSASEVVSCDRSSSLSKQYKERVKKEAWNSDGKTYLQLAKEVGAEKGVDPALLLAHATMESSLGQNDECTQIAGKSSLTGCGWYPKCSDGCRCEPHEDGLFASDRAQLECSARVDNGAFKAEGLYEKCGEYENNPMKFFNCIMCTYQGDYYEILEGSGGKKYFTRDGTCSYAKSMKSLYCGWKQYLEKKTEFYAGGSEDYYITMEADQPVEIPIDVNVSIDEEELSAKGESYPNGILGTYKNERIVDCGGGECLADIAEYYHNTYPEYDYVWGGESPYTYEDTIKLSEKSDSFFYSIRNQISEKQPDMSAFTKPGFDCS